MYYGDALLAAPWFDHLGFGLPYGTNLAGAWHTSGACHMPHATCHMPHVC